MNEAGPQVTTATLDKTICSACGFPLPLAISGYPRTCPLCSSPLGTAMPVPLPQAGSDPEAVAPPREDFETPGAT